MIRYARLAAAVLPLLGLGGLWMQSDRTYHTGTEWEVPIQGYDPRDYLRGHYVEFQYDWPGLEEPRLGFAGVERLCLDGTPPLRYRARAITSDAALAKCAHPLRAPDGGVYGSNGLVNGRLYIGQERAAQLERQLQNRDQRGIVTIRQREDGSFTPISIRFRPLTPQEIAERDAPPPSLEPAAPPIMERQP
jgi:GDYXXLXY protein